MDITVSWSPSGTVSPTDTYDVFYKVWQPGGLNPWVKANPSPLPSTATSYVITGLDVNTIYRVSITKYCNGVGALVDEVTVMKLECPTMSIYQSYFDAGIPQVKINYSLIYSAGQHITNARVFSYETPVGTQFANSCPTPAIMPVGRTSYITYDACEPQFGADVREDCNQQILTFPLPTPLNSGNSVYGLNTSPNFNSSLCDGFITRPIRYQIGKTYKFEIINEVDLQRLGIDKIDYIFEDTNCTNSANAPTYSVIQGTANNSNRISGAFFYNSTNGQVNCYLLDGTAQTNINSYTLRYFTNDATLSSQLPLYANNDLVTSPNVNYEVFVPINCSPPLDPSFISSGMRVEVILNNPNPNYVRVINNVDYSGFTFAQMLSNIASNVTANTPNQSSAFTYSGTNYLNIGTNGGNYTSGTLRISGPAMYGFQNGDLPQTTLSNQSYYGINSAEMHLFPSGDRYIFGSRNSLNNPNAGLINVTKVDTVAPSTVDYTHPISFPHDKVAFVPQAAPTQVFDIQPYGTDVVTPGSLNVAVRKASAPVWNEGYTYVGDLTSIKVYDTTNALVDTYTPPGIGTEPIRLLQFNQTTGHLYIICENLTTGTPKFFVINSVSLGIWAIINSGTTVSDSYGWESTITGYDDYYSIWAPGANQWSLRCRFKNTPALPSWNGTQDIGLFSEYVVEVLTCAANPAAVGRQLVLCRYCPSCNPPITTASNNTSDTLFIDPTHPLNAGWTTILQASDRIALLGPYSDRSRFIDWNATWPVINNWDITIESNTGRGMYAKASTSVFLSYKEVAVSGLVSGWNNTQTSPANYRKTTYGTRYRIGKYRDGNLIHNPVANVMAYSRGDGKVQLWNSAGTQITNYQLLNPNNTPFIGSVQLAYAPNGNMYGVVRDVTLNGKTAAPDDAVSQIKSPHLYYLERDSGTVFISSAAISGTTTNRWDDDLAGAISITVESGITYVYATSAETRRIFKIRIGPSSVGVFTEVTVPSLYKKLDYPSTPELLCGIVQYKPGQFIVMNMVKTTKLNLLTRAYDFTDLFIYDYANNEIVQALIGTGVGTYSGSAAAYNPNNLGQIFGEFNFWKNYGYGLMSLTVYNAQKIIWRDYSYRGTYSSQEYAESGVAQLWTISRAGYLIRIFNVDSAGVLTPSKRTIYTRPAKSDGGHNGFTDITYSSYYNALVGIIQIGSYIQIIDPTNFSGYWGNSSSYTSFFPSIDIASSTLYPTTYVNNVTNSFKITVADNGNVYILGNKNSSSAFTYQVWTPADLTSGSGPSLGGITGDGTNPGVYETGSFSEGNPGMSYPHLYVSSQNEIWTLATDAKTIYIPGPPPVAKRGNQIIAVYNAATMALKTTINLSDLNIILPYTQPPYASWNHVYLPGEDKVLYYSGSWSANVCVIVDPATKQIVYKGTINAIINKDRSPVLNNQNIGTIIPYKGKTGFFIDINTNTTTGESWTYINTTSVTYTGLTHNIFSVTVDGNPLVTNDDVYTIPGSLTAFTAGQWKVTNAVPIPPANYTVWNNIVGGGTININPNEVIEFTMFDPDRQLFRVINVSQGTTYDSTDPAYVQSTSLPRWNVSNSINVFSIEANGVDLLPGDLLEFYFVNPSNPTIPFINSVNINF